MILDELIQKLVDLKAKHGGKIEVKLDGYYSWEEKELAGEDIEEIEVFKDDLTKVEIVRIGR